MSTTHAHLLLNHFPTVGFVMTIGLFLAGLVARSDPLKRASLAAFVATALIARVQQGMASRSFTVGPLSEKEVCLRHFCRRMRELIPEARQAQPPPTGWSRP